ncbi:MAG: hypothetical protein ACK5LS_07650, partial [Propioniciclava sp.]
MITDLDTLSPAARETARAWLDTAVAGLDLELRPVVREDLHDALCGLLDPGASPVDVQAVAAELGPVIDPTAEADAGLGSRRGSGEADRDPRVGTFAGVPYDWRPPTAERLRRRLWDPTNEKLAVPRVFGAGWDLNLGALAVRLGLIEPDAEDVPFDRTPEGAFALAAVLPVSLAGAVVLHYLVRGRSLPDLLPNHWGWRGAPDGWVRRGTATTMDIGAALGIAGAAVTAAVPGRSGPARAGVLAA